MTNSFYITETDTSPNYRFTLKADGAPVNLLGYQEVAVKMTNFFDSSILVSDNTLGSVAVVDAANGVVEYQWKVGDTKTGWYKAEWTVTYTDGKTETFPNDGASLLKIDHKE